MVLLAGGARLRDVHVCGLDHVEVMGNGESRYVFFTLEMTAGGIYRRKAKLSLVMNNEALPDAVMKSCTAASLALMGGVIWKPQHKH